MPKCADTDKQKISQYRLPISEPIIGATLVHIHLFHITICEQSEEMHVS